MSYRCYTTNLLQSQVGSRVKLKAVLTLMTGFRRSPRKPDKRPVYVLHLKTSQEAVDTLLQPSKTVMYLAVSYLILDVVALII